MNKLLLIDDNREILDANSEYLQSKGYEVDVAINASKALHLLKKKNYDCIVLDVMLPDMDGYSLCEKIRETVETPIIFLSCLGHEDDQIKGLFAGADDYMAKPYSIKELATRIHAQIRRDKLLARRQENIESPTPGVIYNKDSHTITVSGINLIMSSKECMILNRLIAAQGGMVKRRELLDITGIEDASFAVYIQRIRNKLEMDASLGKIVTFFGKGYAYEKK